MLAQHERTSNTPTHTHTHTHTPALELLAWIEGDIEEHECAPPQRGCRIGGNFETELSVVHTAVLERLACTVAGAFSL